MSLQIAVLDDEKSIVDIATLVLQHSGFQADGFENKEQFLQVASAYDLLVTDYHMKGYTGFDVLTQLRNRKISMPVVCMSGNITRIPPLERGKFSRVIEKPFTNDYLIEVVRDSLSQPYEI